MIWQSRGRILAARADSSDLRIDLLRPVLPMARPNKSAGVRERCKVPFEGYFRLTVTFGSTVPSLDEAGSGFESRLSSFPLVPLVLPAQPGKLVQNGGFW